MTARGVGLKPPDGDAGNALVEIGARFAELVVQRINRAPTRHYHAFLNLIGVEPGTPLAARVPLTFTPAERGPAAVVPAGTQVAAPPTSSSGQEAVFETEHGLALTRSLLTAVFVGDEKDRYGDRSEPATRRAEAEEESDPFKAFVGEHPMPHHLYLAADPVLSAPGEKNVTITLATTGPQTSVWGSDALSWQTWNGTSWEPLERVRAVLESGSDAFQGYLLERLPGLLTCEVAGISGSWLRLELDVAKLRRTDKRSPEELFQLGQVRIERTPPSNAAVPDVALLNGTPIDLTMAFRPFGEQPRFNDTLYLAVPPAMALPSSQLALEVTLSMPAGGAPITDGPAIGWEASNGRDWREVKPSGGKDGPNGVASPDTKPHPFTGGGELWLTLPDAIAPTSVAGVERYWVRARLLGEPPYGKPPGPTTPIVQRLAWRHRSAPSIPVSAAIAYDDSGYRKLWTTGAGMAAATSTPIRPFTIRTSDGTALYLGFDRPFEIHPVTLCLLLDQPQPGDVAVGARDALRRTVDAPTVGWEYATDAPAAGRSATEARWRPLEVADETEGFARSGLVHFVGPTDLAERSCFGKRRYWLRARRQPGTPPFEPRLRRVLVNTVWASQATTITSESLGSGNGDSQQTLQIAQTPVLPGQQLLVREPERPPPDETAALVAEEGEGAISASDGGDLADIWVRWHEVRDFYDSRPTDRHYTVDRFTGQLSFGDGKQGRRLPRGQNNVRITYQTGGGPGGNRPQGSVTQLKSGVPYVDAVTNHEVASGGSPAESVERVSARGPTALRHGGRAVTVQDLEDLAVEASSEVARARAVSPNRFDAINSGLWLPPGEPASEHHRPATAGVTTVVVVPDGTASMPVPSLGLLREVEGYLLARCPATAEVQVVGPEWFEVAVVATVAASATAADQLAERVTTTLARYLHPLSGGPTGAGWAFGRNPHPSDLHAVVAGVAGVDYVLSLDVKRTALGASRRLAKPLVDRMGRRLGESVDLRAPALEAWCERALVCSGQHRIRVALVPSTPSA